MKIAVVGAGVTGLVAALRLGQKGHEVTVYERWPGLGGQAATLDVLTGGRAFCGVGAGWWEREHAAFGMPFPSGSQRVADLERCIETMRALWAPGTKAYDGELVALPETTCYPRPQGALPIIVGGRGRRLLEVAARLGDACNVPPAYARHSARRFTKFHNTAFVLCKPHSANSRFSALAVDDSASRFNDSASVNHASLSSVDSLSAIVASAALIPMGAADKSCWNQP